jgi:hypothetical protein
VNVIGPLTDPTSHGGNAGDAFDLVLASMPDARRHPLYWLTNTATLSARLYWKNNNNNFNAVDQKTAEISVPVAATVFPGEIDRAPQSWTERAYRHLIYFNEVDKGGRFAAWEQPKLFSAEMRAAFRSLRQPA